MRPRVNRPLLFFLLLFCTAPIFSLEISLAPLMVDAADSAPDIGDPVKRLRAEIDRLDPGGAIQLRSLKHGTTERIVAPRTFLEAAALCEELQVELLFYGYLRCSEYTWEGEIKLYDHRAKAIQKLFFSRDGTEEFDRFIGDLAQKIVAYLYEDLGLAPIEPDPPPDANIISLPLYLSYWVPVAADWNRLTRSIAKIESGLLFSPLRPLWFSRGRAWELQTGLTFAYALAVNSPGYESFLLHSLRLNIPALALGRLKMDQIIVFGAGLSLQADLLEQQREYVGEYHALSLAPGFFLEAGYRYFVNPHWSIGIRTAVEVALFEEAQVNLVPGITGLYAFSPGKPGIKKESHE